MIGHFSETDFLNAVEELRPTLVRVAKAQLCNRGFRRPVTAHRPRRPITDDGKPRGGHLQRDTLTAEAEELIDTLTADLWSKVSRNRYDSAQTPVKRWLFGGLKLYAKAWSRQRRELGKFESIEVESGGEGRPATHSVEYLADFQTEAGDELVVSNIIRAEIVMTVRTVLDKLDDELREILLRVGGEGEPLAQVAADLGYRRKDLERLIKGAYAELRTFPELQRLYDNLPSLDEHVDIRSRIVRTSRAPSPPPTLASPCVAIPAPPVQPVALATEAVRRVEKWLDAWSWRRLERAARLYDLGVA